MPDLLHPDEAADKLHVTTWTLADWRYKGEGPPYVKLSGGHKGHVRYPVAELDIWLTERTITPGAS